MNRPMRLFGWTTVACGILSLGSLSASGQQPKTPPPPTPAPKTAPPPKLAPVNPVRTVLPVRPKPPASVVAPTPVINPAPAPIVTPANPVRTLPNVNVAQPFVFPNVANPAFANPAFANPAFNFGPNVGPYAAPYGPYANAGCSSFANCGIPYNNPYASMNFYTPFRPVSSLSFSVGLNNPYWASTAQNNYWSVGPTSPLQLPVGLNNPYWANSFNTFSTPPGFSPNAAPLAYQMYMNYPYSFGPFTNPYGLGPNPYGFGADRGVFMGDGPLGRPGVPVPLGGIGAGAFGAGAGGNPGAGVGGMAGGFPVGLGRDP